MDIDYLRALWKLGRIRPEEVHLAATELLVDGIESPAVVRLAGMTGATFWEIDPVLNEAFLEGNLPHFVYLAADYGEGPGDRASEEAWFDARIIESARELLEHRPRSA